MRLMLVVCLLASFGCSGTKEVAQTESGAAAGQPGPPVEPAHSERHVGFTMRHVRLRAAPDVILDVEALNGNLVARRTELPVFDDLKSFYIAVDSARLSVDSRSLTALVNRVFDYEKSPLSDLTVAIRDGQIEQKGRLHKGLTVPFSVAATVAPDDGRIRLHPVRLRVAGIPATRIMRAFGLELEDVIKVRTGRGVTVRENDLLLEPSQVIPAPEVRGAVTSARIAGDRLSLTIGKGADAAAPQAVPDSEAHNYIWFHGGKIRFGRLTMTDADLQLIDADERDPFDFYSDRYNDQLVAGYSRNTPSGALRTVMPDFGDLGRLPSGRLPNPSVGKPAPPVKAGN
jgi:hypothetical protein